MLRDIGNCAMIPVTLLNQCEHTGFSYSYGAMNFMAPLGITY
jgi:hypothetical protein